MKRIPRSVRRTYGLARNAGIGVVVAGGLLAALFPGQVKHGIGYLLDSLRPAEEVVSEAPELPPVEAPEAPEPPPPSPSSPPSPPPPPPVPAGPPRVAVVGIGDARVADRLGSLLVEALHREGLGHVESGGSSLGVRDLVARYGGQPPASQLAAVLAREGYSALVLGEGWEVASREIAFYGRRDVATKWRIQVSAHHLRGGRGIGPGWGGELETTERGALASLEHFLTPIASQVAPAVEVGLGSS